MHDHHVTTGTPVPDHQCAAGTPVFNAAGAMVGRVRADSPHSGYLTVRTGGLFRKKDRYIPLSAVSRSDAAGVFLQLSKGELKAARYDFPYTPIAYPHVDKVQNTPPATTAMRAGQSASGPEVAPTPGADTAPAPPAGRFSTLDD